MNDLEHRLRRHLQDEATRLTPPPSAGLPARARGGRRPRLLLVAAAVAAVVAGIVMVSASPDQRVEAVDPTTTTSRVTTTTIAAVTTSTAPAEGPDARPVEVGSWDWVRHPVPPEAIDAHLVGDELLVTLAPADSGDDRLALASIDAEGTVIDRWPTPEGTTVVRTIGDLLVAEHPDGPQWSLDGRTWRNDEVFRVSRLDEYVVHRARITGAQVDDDDVVTIEVSRHTGFDIDAYLAVQRPELGPATALDQRYVEDGDIVRHDLQGPFERIEVDRSVLSDLAEDMLGLGGGERSELLQLRAGAWVDITPDAGLVRLVGSADGRLTAVADGEPVMLGAGGWSAIDDGLDRGQLTHVDDELRLATSGATDPLTEVDGTWGRVALASSLRGAAIDGDGGRVALWNGDIDGGTHVVHRDSLAMGFDGHASVWFVMDLGGGETNWFAEPPETLVSTDDGWSFTFDGRTLEFDEQDWVDGLMPSNARSDLLAVSDDGVTWQQSSVFHALGAEVRLRDIEVGPTRAIAVGSLGHASVRSAIDATGARFDQPTGTLAVWIANP